MDRLLELTSLAERSHFWFRGFRWFVTPLIAAAATRRGRILDCGCGTGSNLAMLEPFGQAYGFDLTWRGLEVARDRGRRRIARASIGEIPFPPETFDVVTSFDVLQCLPDAVEAAAMREMARVLRPGGAAVLSFAALDILRGQHSVLSEEVRRYTPGRVRRLVEGAGLIVERLTFAFACLFPIMLPARVASRWLGKGGEPEVGEWEITVPPAPVNGLLTLAVGVEALAVRVVNMPIGSSLLCLARKPG
jgi:SAM-dependent methyltransferase